MLELEETRTGGVWLPVRPITTDEAMQVLADDIPEDGQHRNACAWAIAVFDYPDFISDMPIDAKRQLLKLIARNPAARYSAIHSYLRDQVDVMVDQYNEDFV